LVCRTGAQLINIGSGAEGAISHTSQYERAGVAFRDVFQCTFQRVQAVGVQRIEGVWPVESDDGADTVAFNIDHVNISKLP
jgi:hypothetical protein